MRRRSVARRIDSWLQKPYTSTLPFEETLKVPAKQGGFRLPRWRILACIGPGAFIQRLSSVCAAMAMW